MSGSFQELIGKYHAYYQVSPYHIVAEQQHGSRKGQPKNRIQSGFDVDVYGLSDKDAMDLPPASDYSVGFAELKKIADTVSDSGGCFIEVIPFPSAAVIDTSRHFRPQAAIRIRISHAGDVDEPAGLPEQKALQQIEQELQALGITRR